MLCNPVTQATVGLWMEERKKPRTGCVAEEGLREFDVMHIYIYIYIYILFFDSLVHLIDFLLFINNTVEFTDANFQMAFDPGGLVLSGGLLGFVLSRNPTILSTGVLFGGALLALSIFSLKIWRQGKSSMPFVLGQAVLSAALLWKNFQAYLLTKKLIPTGFYVVISAAMLCFYSYVMISGGNPPPKKLHSSTVMS
ncbi:hypothetical protein GH714_034960 [Hevea brasiliensis]|uniref:Uncharacterized protein n=1 Tax=Hevea brasiliensis TaxID=3981 RepID=A0A6A6KK69_HEVBR|nr:hypothetical protein GH714_034960 [Hevea brasiliensis]